MGLAGPASTSACARATLTCPCMTAPTRRAQALIRLSTSEIDDRSDAGAVAATYPSGRMSQTPFASGGGPGASFRSLGNEDNTPAAAGDGSANILKRGSLPAPKGGAPAIGAMRWPGAG